MDRNCLGNFLLFFLIFNLRLLKMVKWLLNCGNTKANTQVIATAEKSGHPSGPSPAAEVFAKTQFCTYQNYPLKSLHAFSLNPQTVALLNPEQVPSILLPP